MVSTRSRRSRTVARSSTPSMTAYPSWWSCSIAAVDDTTTDADTALFSLLDTPSAHPVEGDDRALVRDLAHQASWSVDGDVEGEAASVDLRQLPVDVDLLALEHRSLVADADVRADRRLAPVEVLLRRIEARHLDQLDHRRRRQHHPGQVWR